MTLSDEQYMRRALRLAANGRGFTSPNPMVGAVIVGPGGRILGEGWHRIYGGPHAEVNAVASVSEADSALFGKSTIYVTLEPCSHYGKTPPCALLLRECGFRRVVVGAGDPNPRVSGRGIAMLREAGIEVTEGVLSDECRLINKRFMTAHTLRRPFVTLKWAQSADGFMDHARADGEPAARFSTPLSAVTVHRRRAVHDAIAVGAATVIADTPRLDTRLCAGHSPRPVVFDRRGLGVGQYLLDDPRGTIYIGADRPLQQTLAGLYADEKITSLLVEGGASLLRSFIGAGLWDEAYVEVAPRPLGAMGRTPAPAMAEVPVSAAKADGNTVFRYVSSSFRSLFPNFCEDETV